MADLESSQNTILTSDVEDAARRLRAGELVAFATETVYGLGANALCEEAVAKIFAAKQRPRFDPLIVHLSDAEQLQRFAREISEPAAKLADAFWPGPLTLVLSKQDCIPDIVTSGQSTVALRVPQPAQSRELIARAGCPIAAPSANPFGRVSPTTAQHVMDSLKGKIGAVLEGGQCEIGVESTIVSLVNPGRPCLLRPGGLAVEQIEELIGPVQRLGSTQSAGDRAPMAPGMLDRHYAPTVTMHIVDDIVDFQDRAHSGLLAFGAVDRERFQVVEQLSESASLLEAATNFFSALRRLENQPIKRIVATRFPNHGLGLALNDRLERAAAKESPNA